MVRIHVYVGMRTSLADKGNESIRQLKIASTLLSEDLRRISAKNLQGFEPVDLKLAEAELHIVVILLVSLSCRCCSQFMPAPSRIPPAGTKFAQRWRIGYSWPIALCDD